VSPTLIPEADPNRLFELEETGETSELRKLAEQTLEDAEITREYDIGYRIDQKKTLKHSGTHYSSHEVSPYYDNSEPDITIPIESNVEEFYANLDGEFRLIDNKGKDRTYKLVISRDEGMVLKGEVGFEQRDITDFRYTRTDNFKRLHAYLDDGWCKFGEADKIGEGNRTMKHIELIESAYKQLKTQTHREDQDWEIVYSSNLEEDLEKLPAQVEKTLYNKSGDFEQNLSMGLEPEKIFKTMISPWKPLLEMNLGRNYRALFVESNKLPNEKLPEDLIDGTKIVGLSARPKTDFHDNFRINPGRKDSGDTKTNGINYALNLL
jgi:hypothetical protein